MEEEREKENSTELQKPNIDTEVYNNNKKCDWIYTYTYIPIGSVQSLSCVRLSATPWTAAHQAPLSMGFSKQVTLFNFAYLIFLSLLSSYHIC